MAEAATISVLIQAKDQASAAIKDVGKSMGGLAGTFEKHRKGIATAMTVVGGIVTGVAAMSIKAASDAQEMQNKFDVVFKGMTKEIEGWAKSHAELIGRSRFDLMEYAANLQDTFVPMGIARDEASQLARSIVELSIDLGSFNNLKTEDVVRDMTSAMIGNTESVLKYGVVIKAADLETKALNMGLIDSGEALDAATKAQTIYQLIVAGTTDAQGDAERSVGSFAAEMLRLQANTKEVKVLIGTALLPIITDLIEKVTPIIKGIKEWAAENPVLAERLFKVSAALGAIMLVVGPFLLILPTLVAGIALLTGAFTALMTSMLPITLTVLAIAAAITAGIIIWKNWDDQTNIWIKTLKFAFLPLTALIAIIKNWDKIMDAAKKTVAFLGERVMVFFKSLLQAAAAVLKLVPGMKGLKKEIDDGIKSFDKQAKAMHLWARTGDTSFREVGESASDSQREIAMAAIAAQEDMGGLGNASEVMATEVKSNSEVVAKALEEVAESAKKETVVITAAMRGWGFEMDKATGIVEEQAVAMAESIRNTAEAFQEAGDTAMTGAQEIAAAARLAGKVVEEETTKMESDWDDWMSSMDRQETQLKSILGNMDEEMGLMSAGTLEHLLDMEFGLKEHGKAWEELPDAIGHALDKIPPILGDADFALSQTLDRMGDKLTDNIHSWGDELEGFTAEQNKRIQDEINREKRKREDREKKAAEEEQQRMIEKFKGTPQFASMAAQREKLRSVEHALESQKGALPGMRQAVTQAEAGFNQYRGEPGSPGFQQRSDQYWRSQIRPLMDQVQRQVERIRATRYQVEALESQIAKNVIPLEYRGIAENVLAHEWMRPMQGGGIATGGLALVGERGPEVVSLPGGARVHPSGTGPGGQVNQFHFHGAVYGLEDLRRVVVEAVRDHALSGGFRGVFGEA